VTVGAVTIGGELESDLFLRRPAICFDSFRSSGGGEPDIGGVGSEAQKGAGRGLDNVRSGTPNEFEADRCFLNEEHRKGTWRNDGDCMELIKSDDCGATID
jgi:hypothetical protein